jgi:putative flippase GtrA
MTQKAFWFIVVGSLATATHWLTTVVCVSILGIPPLVANIIGWCVAFFVSFNGHYFLTFKTQEKSLLVAIGRFFVVSLGGFMLNEASLFLLLGMTQADYKLLLAIVLLLTAVVTFLLSQFWAFFHKT